ncbi:hypothetical protein Ppa06_05710 [Planomonospora parontospora subsp. parontospora]|uniref:Uncharacterized protein n=2 Tax=Planomonospora parontospora TaxID=58119 RepID=A0AA37BBY5_9ACTN|nr:hypothetical protein GCM10010126_05720 [Planomonospora parontospora]GII06773.1 hypothetical protein Ppa06_05710 [Planomonospora parontospora subsp. parontospora]
MTARTVAPGSRKETVSPSTLSRFPPAAAGPSTGESPSGTGPSAEGSPPGDGPAAPGLPAVRGPPGGRSSPGETLVLKGTAPIAAGG